jgi:HK97 family phage major capsid protein
VFGKNSLGAYKYDTAGASGDLLKVSWELLQDSEFDITGFIAKKFGERLARKIAVDLINGSGVNEPQGIISTQGALTNSGVTLASATAGPSYAELVTIEHSLDPAYRANASWLMNDKTLSLLEQLVDTTGRPLVWGMANSLGEGRQPKTLLGYPVVIDQAMPDMLTGSTKGIVFGDLSETYIVRTVKDMAILQDPYSYIRTGQTGFLAWMRLDAMVQNVNSAVYATSHS